MKSKRKKQKTVKAWAVFCPEGDCLLATPQFTKKETQKKFEEFDSFYSWSGWEKLGYRCLPVEIKVRTR